MGLDDPSVLLAPALDLFLKWVLPLALLTAVRVTLRSTRPGTALTRTASTFG
jgi:hypothetical protein